jgi:hypothetical protein
MLLYSWSIKIKDTNVIIAPTPLAQTLPMIFHLMGLATTTVALTVTDDNPTAIRYKTYDIIVGSCCTPVISNKTALWL